MKHNTNPVTAGFLHFFIFISLNFNPNPIEITQESRKKRIDLPNSDKIDNNFICLPIHQDVNLEDLEYIIKAVKSGW